MAQPSLHALASMTAAPDSLQQRYEAIEQDYSEYRWDDVAQQSEALLQDLPDDPSHPLRQRLQLLLGHTYLYGYQDAATASGFYSRVRAATAEAVLQEIADQGLEQCAVVLANATPDTQPTSKPEPEPEPAFPPTVEPTPAGTDATGSSPAMPWMEQLGDLNPTPRSPVDPLSDQVPRLPVEVVDEPELIEVAQANPATAEQLDVTVAESSNRFSPEEKAELSKGLLRVVIR